MFKKILILQILFLLLLSHAEAGRRVVAVRTIRSSHSQQAIAGFKSEVDVDITFLNASEFPRKEDFDRRIRDLKPEMVLAIGQDSLIRVSHLKTVPVAYLFAFNAGPVSGKDNFFGMAVHLNYEVYMAAVKKTLPSVKHIGFLYDASKAFEILETARSAAQKNGLSLVATAITGPVGIAPALMKMDGRVDAILMYPDISIFTRDTLAFLFLYSMEKQIPVVSFSDKFLPLGAAVSVDNSSYESGREVGRLARKVFEGHSFEVSHLEGRSPVVTLNKRVIKILGVDAGRGEPVRNERGE